MYTDNKRAKRKQNKHKIILQININKNIKDL